MTNRKPRDDEIDVYGLSDCGKVRARNEDHFLLASIHRRVNVIGTNLSEVERLRSTISVSRSWQWSPMV
ncbi:MAG TPA: hypothetical protein VN717_01020 [Gemmatimonadaceae bacterium]|nr:hypothetical protein [Gemmatimonadaceae bacterium]